MKKFWNWMNNADSAERELRIEGAIAEDSWFGDEVTPAEFKAELLSGNGPITLWINSPGGDCVAASQIYTMLKEYPNSVNVKIDGMAASAASVIAMAGSKVSMSPTALLMIHNPLTMAFGDAKEMESAINVLNEVKESIINAYEAKTGLSRARLSHLMDNETWMSAKKAFDLGFCDEVLYSDEAKTGEDEDGMSFSAMAVMRNLVNKVTVAAGTEDPVVKDGAEPEAPVEDPVENDRVCVDELERRLATLKYI